MRMIAAAALAAIGLATQAEARSLTPAERQSLPRSLSEGMRDPASAQFRFTRVARTAAGADVVCGMVNGRNGFGGMTGFQPFVALISGPRVQRPFIAVVGNAASFNGEQAMQMCRTYGLDPAAAR